MEEGEEMYLFSVAFVKFIRSKVKAHKGAKRDGGPESPI